ncbi:hypothetical protein FM115_08280 [Marinilactibacillus psychrotolerans 42ea]|uniref:Anti-bacteriophage protein A/HamA C-terminal domain-containing protein n=1 Tax=Marinilactibacillus psychrotolerans 42ea TaxID=1255609 RepID=A0A1R4K605_9LACT|nr:DUF1837 domain-containing protein [Marinilactibacillus psychrotolerans]SJN39678.1 hypothetical protein FM115_08280 [Marinilactibacillus psychrotolerans 42ea]
MSNNHSEYLQHNDSVHVFYIKYDLLDDGIGQLKDKFNSELFDDIPAFAFGANIMDNKLREEGIVPTVREAMKKMYAIPEIQEAQKEYLDSTSTEDKYLRRGEFGELILYHLLHEYFDAEALISKIYFKDSAGIPAHGFDAVHVDLQSETLWLGESKLYRNPTSAIDELIKDVVGYTDNKGKVHKGHFSTDFFNSEFQIITNRVHDNNIEYPEFVQTLVSPNTRTLDKLANINIALFAAFDSNSVKNFDEEMFQTSLKKEINKLIVRANDGLKEYPWNNQLSVFLFLFPLDDKRAFVSSLHQKLKGAQQI